MSHKTTTPNIVYTNTIHTGLLTNAAHTSDAQLCSGAKSISLFFTETLDSSAKEATLTVTVSADGTNFHAYNMLITNTAESNAETLIRVASVARQANGTDILWFTPETLGAINYFKVVVTIDATVGNGSFAVMGVVQY